MGLDQLTLLAAQHVVHGIQADVKALAAEITALGREVDQIAELVARNATSAADPATKNSLETASGRLALGMHANLIAVAAQVDARLQSEYIQTNGGLRKPSCKEAGPELSSRPSSTI